jgi:hypothetical protein
MSCSLIKAISPSDNDYTVPAVVAGAAVALRLHSYRHIRKVVVPAGLAALIYRACYSSDADSLLAIINKFVASLNSKQVSVVGGDLLGCVVGFTVIKSLSYALTLQPGTVVSDILNAIFDMIKCMPFVKSELLKERAKMEEVIDHDLKAKVRLMGHPMHALPKVGMAADEILSFMTSLIKTEDAVWENGRVSGSVYHGDREHQKLLNAAFSIYSLANPLHPDMWPSSTKLEAEIISMCASMMTTKCKTLCG